MILTQELWEEYTAAVTDEINWEGLVNSNLTTQACAAANATNWKLQEVLKQNAELVKALQLSNEGLKTFADNVKQTNAEIDKNWAETVYPLKAENQRLRAALHHCVKALAEFEKDSNLPIEQFQYNVVFKLKGYLLGALDNARSATGGE